MAKRTKQIIYNKSKEDILKELDNYPDVLSTEELMKILGINTNRVYKLLNFGEVECPRLHKDFIIPRNTVRHHIMDLPTENFINIKEVE